MKKFKNHNLSVPLVKVDAFLSAMDNKGTSPAENARIANELISALREARENLTKGINERSLTVCIGKGAYVDPADFQKFLSREIPRLTIYNTRKPSRHMALYYKHTPQFYLDNQPKKATGPRPIRKPKGK